MFDCNRRYMVAGLIVMMLIVFVGGIKYGDLRQADPDPEMILSGNASMEQVPTGETDIQVYVSGEVEKPGLYKLKSGARVQEALDMAGILPTADLQNAQPARKLQDGETIVLFPQGQNPGITVANNSGANNSSAVAHSTPGLTSASSTGMININTASVQELDERLPGIGPTLAQRIVDYRSSNGAFTSIEDINNVSGIGDKKFADLKDLITVR